MSEFCKANHHVLFGKDKLMWIYIEENIELLQKEVISGKDKANEMRTLADLLIVILSLFCLFL